MSPTLLALAVLLGCTADTSFHAGNDNNDNIQGTGDYNMLPAGDLVWEGLVPGYTCSKYVRLDSVGEEPLVINRIDITETGGGVFSMEEIRDVSVDIGDSLEFSIQARLQTAEPATGELRISSNDKDEVDARVTLQALPAEDWDTGDTGIPECP
ncbi:MAG: hypothetical protein D6798_15205 [Deltaproteobacteria bacterium]|nr:MAG: hypothetical protein D6798_15205 [Deltaproteobacteria bacterium]